MSDPSSLRLVFAGTPDFAATHLAALLKQGVHQVVAVYCQPDRRSGRGKRARPGPVKQLALEHDLPVYQPATLGEPDRQAELAALAPDVMVVVAYGLILPPAVLAIPRLGCINVHASLLPRWRGAAPIQRALEAGDAETGVAIMQMDRGLDTGPVLLERRLPITEDDTGGSLHDRLAELGSEALQEGLAALAAGRATPRPQPDEGVCYAHKIDKQELELNWDRPADEVARKIRAMAPQPGCWSTLDGVRVKLLHARAIAGQGEPGTLLAARPEGLDVACGTGAVRIATLQLPGGRALAIRDLLNARADQFSPGRRFR